MALVLASLVEVKLPKNDKYIMEGLYAPNILKVLEKEGNNRYSAFIYYVLANYYEGKPRCMEG